MPFISINPTTEDVNASYDSHSDEHVQAEIGRAHGAFDSWKKLSFADRAVFMVRAAELLESEIPVVAELMSSPPQRAKRQSVQAQCVTTLSTLNHYYKLKV